MLCLNQQHFAAAAILELDLTPPHKVRVCCQGAKSCPSQTCTLSLMKIVLNVCISLSARLCHDLSRGIDGLYRSYLAVFAQYPEWGVTQMHICIGKSISSN